MTSEDVIHAPWFVSMGIKEDIMPSQVTKQWLIADEVEDFLLLCTEYCGDNHAYMIAGISVHA
jgi:cytochrome c oxidase subunit 2